MRPTLFYCQKQQKSKDDNKPKSPNLQGVEDEPRHETKIINFVS
jgi:hypothetical protein